LKGIAFANQNKGKHIIVSKIEHHSVLNSARFLEKQGFAVTYLPVDKHGLIDPAVVEKAITKETTLVSIIHASPEIGTTEPIADIGNIVKQKGIFFHTDAVASAGNIPVDVQHLNVDLLSLAAHQFYGHQNCTFNLWWYPGERQESWNGKRPGDSRDGQGGRACSEEFAETHQPRKAVEGCVSK
jgi:cysteine sulfinate desulfinase/cysteine desulfurase-like protein